MVKETETFLKKAEVTFALSFLALSGRPQAFIHAVHKEKNHEGEIKFAQVIADYIKIDESVNFLLILGKTFKNINWSTSSPRPLLYEMLSPSLWSCLWMFRICQKISWFYFEQVPLP